MNVIAGKDLFELIKQSVAVPKDMFLMARYLKELYSEKFHVSDFWFYTLYREWLAKYR